MAGYVYRHMSVQEFARNLDETGLTLGQFARLTGLGYDNLKTDMLQGKTVPIPHVVRVLFALMALPGGLSIARQITDAVIDKTSEFDEGAKRRFGSGEEGRNSMAEQRGE